MTRKFVMVGFILSVVLLGFVQLADAKEKTPASDVIRWTNKPGQFAKDFSNYLRSHNISHVLNTDTDAVIVPVSSQRSCSVSEQLDRDLNMEQIEVHCISDEVVDTVAFAIASLHITSEHCEGFYADKDTNKIYSIWRMPWSNGFVIPGGIISLKIVSGQGCFNKFVKPDYRQFRNKLEQKRQEENKNDGSNGNDNGGNKNPSTPPKPPSPEEKSSTAPSGDSI